MQRRRKVHELLRKAAFGMAHRVGSATQLGDTEGLARFHDRFIDRRGIPELAVDFIAERSGHAHAQHAHADAVDAARSMPRKANVVQTFAGGHFEHFQ
jgi:hypothetical protein